MVDHMLLKSSLNFRAKNILDFFVHYVVPESAYLST